MKEYKIEATEWCSSFVAGKKQTTFLIHMYKYGKCVLKFWALLVQHKGMRRMLYVETEISRDDALEMKVMIHCGKGYIYCPDNLKFM